MIDEVRGDCRALETRRAARFAATGTRSPTRRGRSGTRSTTRASDAELRRRDQHPVHVGHDGVPEGRHALAPQHPQQRLLRRPPARLHRGRPRVRARALLPLLRDGAWATSERRRTASTHRDPGAGVRARRPRCRRCRTSAAHRSTACRPCSSPSSRSPTSRSYDLSSLRTGIMAGLAVPGRGDEARRGRDAHGRGHDHVRHDRDVAGVDHDPARATTSSAARRRSARCMPHVEMQIVDPETGPRRPARRAGRGVHPRLLGDARLLGRARADRGGDRRAPAGCTPATSATMDDDGYVAIVGRIKDMVIRGGENIYPREIEEFLYTPPRHRRRPGDRRARREVRRGADGLGAAACRRRRASRSRRVREFCAGQLAHYKVPRYLHLTDEFPMTVTGKVRKVEMRERSIELLRLDGTD